MLWLRSRLKRHETMLLRTIVHPTDCAPASFAAFTHALRIALETKGRLVILHFLQDRAGEGWQNPREWLRHTFEQWGYLDRGRRLEDIDIRLGMQIENVAIHHAGAPSDQVVHYLNQHACDLVILPTHAREGIDRLLKGSIAETIFREAKIATLFVPHHARGFVDQITGDFRLRRVLIPIDGSPNPYRAMDSAQALAKLLTGANVEADLLHVGSRRPDIGSSTGQIILRHGNVVQTILDASDEYDVDLICMPTAGRHGVLDAIRGSTTERVLRNAPCPLLAVAAT
jgi:nucleotide-binding universal stress UspA family protein